MKKKIIFAIATGFFAVATVFNMNMFQPNSTGDVSLEAIAIMAQAQSESGGGGGTGGVDYSKGYTNNPQPCTVVEYETHQYCFKVYIPWKGEWGVVCEWDYSQRKEYPGTSNYCTYSAGGSGCSYHTCIKN